MAYFEVPARSVSWRATDILKQAVAKGEFAGILDAFQAFI
jgi:hypothetical protein